MSKTETVGEPFRLIDEDSVVTAQKLFTRMGERLELRAETLGAVVRLDAIALESVAWQDDAVMVDRAAAVDRSDTLSTPDSIEIEIEREKPITVSSEFAQVRVRKVKDDEREQLEIEAPKLGYAIRLGPRELEWLTLQDYETFSSWLEHPFGPDADDHDNDNDHDHDYNYDHDNDHGH